jgi:hypothetical protein
VILASREDLRQPAIAEAQGAFENGSKHAVVIGGDGEVAAWMRRHEARPITVNVAAAHAPTQNPDDVAVAVDGAAVAILMNRAVETRIG